MATTMGSGRSQSRGRGGARRQGSGAAAADASVATGAVVRSDLPATELANLIQELTEQMHAAAANLQFEVAAHRLEHELRAPIHLETLPYTIARRTRPAVSCATAWICRAYTTDSISGTFGALAPGQHPSPGTHV